MGSDAWGIVGYGLRVEESILDWKKCAEMIKERYDKSVVEELKNVTNEDEFYKFLDRADIYFDGRLIFYIRKRLEFVAFSYINYKNRSGKKVIIYEN